MEHTTRSLRCDDTVEDLAEFRLGVTEAGIELFAAYGISLSTNQAQPANTCVEAGMSFLAVTGFGAPSFSGYVVLETSEEVLRKSNSTSSSSADWMAELSNQFLGRIKNRMMRQGTAIHRVPAAVLAGPGKSLVCPGNGVPAVTLSNGHSFVSIWIKSEPIVDHQSLFGAAPDHEWEAGSGIADEGEVLAEGEMVLF